MAQWIALAPRSPRAHLVLFALGLCVRLLFTGAFVDTAVPVEDDAAQYDAIGWSLAHGGPYIGPDDFRSHRAPAYPFLLAAVYAAFGHSLTAARVAQAAVGAATGCILLAFGAGPIAPGAAMLGAVAWTFFPYSLFFCGTVLSEPLCALLAAAATLCLALLAERGGRSTALAAAWGLLSGFCALARPNMAPMLILGAAWMVVRRRHRSAGIAVLAFALTLLPWTVRNFLVHGHLVPITTMGGIVLWEGNNPHVLIDTDVVGRAMPWRSLPEAEQVRGLTETEIDALNLRLALRFMREHAAAMPGLMTRKFLRLWNPFPHVETRLEAWTAAATTSLLIVLFVAGLVSMARRRDIALVPLMMPVAAIIITGVLYWADSRIRAPADPEIVLIGAVGAWDGLRRWTTLLE